MLQVKKSKNQRVKKTDLQSLIEKTPSKKISQLYWNNMGDHYLPKPHFKINKVSYPGKFWDGDKETYDECLWELIGCMSEKVRDYMYSWTDEEIENNIITPEYQKNWSEYLKDKCDFSLSEIREYLNGKSENEELYEFMDEGWVNVDVVSGSSLEWFVIELLEYHNIVTKLYGGDYKYNGKLELKIIYKREKIIDDLIGN